MNRLFSRKLILLLVPVALFFGGMTAAWAFDDVASCEDSGEVKCCCCAASGEARLDTTFGGLEPKRSEPPGPCGMPKGDCGCGNDTKPIKIPDALRLAKPARLAEDPDLFAESAFQRKVQSALQVFTVLSRPVERVFSHPEHYLRNSSFLC